MVAEVFQVVEDPSLGIDWVLGVLVLFIWLGVALVAAVIIGRVIGAFRG